MAQTSNEILLYIGCRDMADKDWRCAEEDAILLDYLSNCKFDEANHVMDLPDPVEHKIPDDFDCTFYRGAKEKIFEATFENESFTVIVLDEKGWDSDQSEERDQEQVFKFFNYINITDI